MSTLIDSLVVELNLDAKNFSPKAKEAVNDLKRLEDASDKRSKSLQDGTKKEAEALRGLTGTALELFAVFTGATGITDFVVSTIKAGSEVGRLSRAIGVSATEISKWQGVAREFGSTGENMAGAYKSLSDVFTAWQVGGPEAPAIMQIFRVINTEAERLDKNNAKTIDGTKGVNAALLATADNLKIIHDLAGDKNLAAYLAGKIPGMDAGLFDAMIQGGDKLAETLKKVTGWTDAEAEAATKLQRRWEALKVSAENFGLRALFGVIDAMHTYSGAPTTGSEPVVNSQKVSEMSGYQSAIASIESRGSGGYAAKGPVTSSGDRAYGKYQIMGNNIGPWSQAALGKTLSIQEFMASPDAQDAIFNHRFGQYVKQYGNPQDAASAWLTGRPLATGGNARDLNGTSGAEYARRFTAALPDRGGGSSGSTTVEINGPVTVTGVRDPVDFTNKLRDLGLKRQAEANQSSVGGQ
jgi:hypothetical protein